MASAPASMTPVKTIRPPNCSVHTPRKIRESDPVRIGVATRRPNSVSFRLSSLLIWIPMMEKIVQTAKLMVNAKVPPHSASCCGPRCGPASVLMTMVSGMVMA